MYKMFCFLFGENEKPTKILRKIVVVQGNIHNAELMWSVRLVCCVRLVGCANNECRAYN